MTPKIAPSIPPTNTSAMDNAIWELREVYRCIGARLVKIQNKRAVYGPVPAPVDPTLLISEPFSGLRGRASTSGSGVSVGLVNELIEEMDLAVLALRLCCVKIEIEREGLRGLLPLPLTTPARGLEKEQREESLGGRAGSSNGQSSVVSMAERPHPHFPPQTQFRPLNSNRNSHNSSNHECGAGVEQMRMMKEAVPATTMELVFPKVETGGVGGTVKDQATAPYENTERRTIQRGSYISTSGGDNTAKAVGVERLSAGEKKSTTTDSNSRRQPAQAPAHPPPARTTSLALPRSKAGATRKIAKTVAVATNLKKSPYAAPSVPISTPAPAPVSGSGSKSYTTQKDKEQQNNGPHDDGDDKPDEQNLGESARRRYYHRQQVAHAQVQVHHTQETQQQVKHQHRIGTGTGTGIAGDNQGHFDETKGILIKPPTTSKYNKPLPGTRTHSPSPLSGNGNGNGNGSGNSNSCNLNSTTTTTTSAPYKYSQSHHHKKRNNDIPNNMTKEQRQNRPGENEEGEPEEHSRASRERGRGGGDLQKEDRSSSFLGTVKGAIKGVFNGTMT